MFLDELNKWNPSAWAKSFSDAGAKYVVIVSKHHEGFCLWPTEVKNSREQNWFSKRDIIGELAEAVRKEGMRYTIRAELTGRFGEGFPGHLLIIRSLHLAVTTRHTPMPRFVS